MLQLPRYALIRAIPIFNFIFHFLITGFCQRTKKKSTTTLPTDWALYEIWQLLLKWMVQPPWQQLRNIRYDDGNICIHLLLQWLMMQNPLGYTLKRTIFNSIQATIPKLHFNFRSNSFDSWWHEIKQIYDIYSHSFEFRCYCYCFDKTVMTDDIRRSF